MRKAAGSHDSTACAKYMILISNYALPANQKPADAYACYYVEHHGYTDVQGYAVEPRHVTFGRKTHRYNLIFVNGVGGGNYSIAPNGAKVFNRPTSSPSLKFTPLPLVAGTPIGRGVITIRGVRAWETEDYAITDHYAVTDIAVTDNNAVIARYADERCSTTARCKRKYKQQITDHCYCTINDLLYTSNVW